MAAILPSTFDVSKLSFSEPKVNDLGGKSVWVNYEGRPFTVETTLMPMPFDINMYDDPKIGRKYSLDVSFRDVESNPKVKALMDMLHTLDERIIQEASTQSFAWFKVKNQNPEVCKALYNPMLKYARDKVTGDINPQYKPTMSIKLPMQRDKKAFAFKLFDKSRAPIDVTIENGFDIESTFTRGSSVRCIMQCKGLWFVNGNFGCTWNAREIKLIPGSSPTACSFADDEDDVDVDVVVENIATDIVCKAHANTYRSDEVSDDLSDGM